MTYPFASLPENLAAFCAVLRRDHRFRIGPRELMDAAHGLEFAEITNERAVRDVLRPILSKSFDDMNAFDLAFDRFFRGGREARRSRESPGATDSGGEPPDRDATSGITLRSPEGGTSDSDIVDANVGAGAVHRVEEPEADATAMLLRASYSPLAGEGAPLLLEPPTPSWLEAAAALAAGVRTARSRRWRPAVHGPRFDFRRTLRTSLHTAGEPVTPRWRAHPRHRSRFLLLIDGSRSMGNSAQPALQTAVALSAVSALTETFTFSTMLWRITRDVRRAAGGERRTVHVQQAWGGGTTIGACLDEFLLLYGERLLDQDTVVIIASDGLDVGNPDLLRQSMARLARRSASIVWINPLLDTTGYEPRAVGMSLARPYVTVLTSVGDPTGLRSLARTLRLR